VDRQRLILAVDDEPDLRMIMQRILSMRGYRVVVASGVTEALTVLDTLDEFPDLLVTDVRMPDGVGAELATQVKQARPELPVLYVSGYAEDYARTEGLIGEGVVLQKPFSPAQLAEAVATALGASVSH
jgi:two-component system cell cycle sensor histidine kinase/response regulator CckA